MGIVSKLLSQSNNMKFLLVLAVAAYAKARPKLILDLSTPWDTLLWCTTTLPSPTTTFLLCTPLLPAVGTMRDPSSLALTEFSPPSPLSPLLLLLPPLLRMMPRLTLRLTPGWLTMPLTPMPTGMDTTTLPTPTATPPSPTPESTATADCPTTSDTTARERPRPSQLLRLRLTPRLTPGCPTTVLGTLPTPTATAIILVTLATFPTPTDTTDAETDTELLCPALADNFHVSALDCFSQIKL